VVGGQGILELEDFRAEVLAPIYLNLLFFFRVVCMNKNNKLTVKKRNSHEEDFRAVITGYPLSSVTLKAGGGNFVRKRPTVTFVVFKFPRNV